MNVLRAYSRNSVMSVENVGNQIHFNGSIIKDEVGVSQVDPWKLVRHVPQGGTWHPATDKMMGTDVYGNPDDMSQPWSINWSSEKYTEVNINKGGGQSDHTQQGPHWTNNLKCFMKGTFAH